MTETAHVAQFAPIQPHIRTITFGDIADAIMAGMDDFRAKPTHMYYLALFYPLVTLAAFLVVFNYNLLPLVFPLISGALIVGPIVTITLCEISRKRSKGLDISARTAGNFLANPSAGDISVLAVFLIALFLIWLGTAQTIYSLTLGDPWKDVALPSPLEFLNAVLTTPRGWALIILGNGIGFLFAVMALVVGTVALPLLVDRPVGLAIAFQTAVRAARANPVTLLGWGVIVAMATAAAAAPFLVGLAVVVPILGHSTWHLYRKLVD